MKTRKPTILVPIIPISFYCFYYADLAYGNKLERIKLEAEMILNHEDMLLEWPNGLPTVSEIDEARMKTDEKVFLHPQ